MTDHRLAGYINNPEPKQLKRLGVYGTYILSEVYFYPVNNTEKFSLKSPPAYILEYAFKADPWGDDHGILDIVLTDDEDESTVLVPHDPQHKQALQLIQETQNWADLCTHVNEWFPLV